MGSIWKSPRWFRAAHGFVHLWLFAALVGFWVTKAETWYIRGLGFFMTVLVILFALGRIVIKPFDSASFGAKLYVGLFDLINIFVPWHRLPTWLGILNLGAFRETLRATNLHNTSNIPVTNNLNVTRTPDFNAKYLVKRQDDGYYDDLKKPSMGAASTNSDPVAPAGSSAQATHDSMYFGMSQPGARFGRNVPLDQANADQQNLLVPNPRLVSNELLARDKFKPAGILNLLAAAWIQFETHDWFNHGEPPWEGERADKESRHEKDTITPEQYKPHEIPLPEADRWLECPNAHSTNPPRSDTRLFERAA